jgi:hypothetical protein
MLKKLLSHPQLQGGETRKLKYILKYEVAGLAEARRAEAVRSNWRSVVAEYHTQLIAHRLVSVLSGSNRRFY